MNPELRRFLFELARLNAVWILGTVIVKVILYEPKDKE
jgi:hypothetical protein